MSSRIRQQFYRLESFAMNTDTRVSGSTVKNHISLKMVLAYSATRRTQFRSCFLVYQLVLPQACPLQLPWHLQGRKLIILHLPSSSSTSPPMTSSTVSSVSVARQERRDPCGMDHYPAAVSSKHVERQERWDPCHSDIPEWLQAFRKILWMTEFLNKETHTPVLLIFRTYACEKCGFG